jgi:hypothetical protein
LHPRRHRPRYAGDVKCGHGTRLTLAMNLVEGRYRPQVSVLYATIVLMTDTKIARDDISREAYDAVAARRAHFDQLLWQVPVISLAGQAFLFSISLSPETARTSKIIASFLAVVMTVLSLHLMVKHRQARSPTVNGWRRTRRILRHRLEFRRGRCMVQHGAAIARAWIRISAALAPWRSFLASGLGRGASRCSASQQSSFS